MMLRFTAIGARLSIGLGTRLRTYSRMAGLSFLCAAAFAASALPGVAGTAPPAPADDALIAWAKAIHQEVLVLDAHADIVLPSTSAQYLGADGLSKTHPDKLRQGSVDAVVMALAAGPGPRTMAGDAGARALADEKLAAVTALAADHPDTLTIARTADEILAAHESGTTALVLGFQNARILEGSTASLDVFHEAGVRVFALNHLGHNDFSDSSRLIFDGATGTYEPEAEHGGLSDLGRAAIRRINALGGVVDVSQSSKAATLEAIALSATPVIASHSNVRALSDVTRNLSGEEIDRIGETGGVIHVAAFAAYLVDLSDPERRARIAETRMEAGLPAEGYSYPYELYWEIEDPEKRRAFLEAMRTIIGRSSVDRMIDHMDYIVERIGIDHVGVASDFNHGGGVNGFNDAGEAFNVTLGLLRRGYSPEEIGKIWSGNFLRVLRQAEDAAAQSETTP